jgi:hypothetical protein
LEFKIGDRVRKINSEPGDAHPNGALGIVVGKVDIPPKIAQELVKTYGAKAETQIVWVDWDDLPGIPIVVTGSRLEKEQVQ